MYIDIVVSMKCKYKYTTSSFNTSRVTLVNISKWIFKIVIFSYFVYVYESMHSFDFINFIRVLFHLQHWCMLSQWSPGCYWKFPLKTMTQENYYGDLHIGCWLDNYNYYTSIMYEWTLINTLQSDTFSRMFSQCWTHTKAAVKVPAQFLLIDHTCGYLSWDKFKLQRKSNRLVILFEIVSKVFAYRNKNKVVSVLAE